MSITPRTLESTEKTFFIEKEVSYSSVNTYYTVTAGDTSYVQITDLTTRPVKVSINLEVTVYTGSNTTLGSGSTKTRTVYIYNSNGKLIGSSQIKNSSTSWSKNSTYSTTVTCTDTMVGGQQVISGIYVRILYSQTDDYGGTASCYWNGKTSTSSSLVGQTFNIQTESARGIPQMVYNNEQCLHLYYGTNKISSLIFNNNKIILDE